MALKDSPKTTMAAVPLPDKSAAGLRRLLKFAGETSLRFVGDFFQSVVGFRGSAAMGGPRPVAAG